MHIIAIGCEYTGITTLLEGLMTWGHARGIHHHLDDHFSIPDRQHLSPEDRKIMVTLTPTLKERFQRFQIVYHIRLLHRYEHILLGGFHIEEAVYGPRYYYPGIPTAIREYEVEMPSDTILVHLTAQPAVIEARMASNPHDYPVIQKKDIQPDLVPQPNMRQNLLGDTTDFLRVNRHKALAVGNLDVMIPFQRFCLLISHRPQ